MREKDIGRRDLGGVWAMLEETEAGANEYTLRTGHTAYERTLLFFSCVVLLYTREQSFHLFLASLFLLSVLKQVYSHMHFLALVRFLPLGFGSFVVSWDVYVKLSHCFLQFSGPKI
ncbi:hypothetical protein NE237_023455 [Protea cynaroides]|uniref:Uncharacterized protein n=1 Tax=Protea cynaroides TaxID=273540 RepID=A0A9Q0HBI4_9MAGN|nr:hypothetical protein NE237_023455 [Protea cynaroides]